MPKRKRQELHEDVRSQTTRSVTANRQTNDVVLRCQKLLSRSLKLAKGFERQKLSRRLKLAQSDDKTKVPRIEAEIEAWKRLDPSSLAKGYLSRIVSRDIQLRSAQGLTASAVTHLEQCQDQTANNVTARLYNSNPVKTAVIEVVSCLRQAAGLAVGKEECTSRPEKRESMAKPHGSPISGSQPRSLMDEPESPPKHRPVDGTGKAYFFEESIRGASPSIASDQVSDIKTRMISPLSEGTTSPPNESWDADDRQSEDTSGDEAPVLSSKLHGNRDSRPRERDSTYLPSLTMSGFVLGSDSEFSDDGEDENVATQRKNRRGQRARQQIWEKKYGAQAKHKQKSRKTGLSGRDDGWDLRRGAQKERNNDGRRTNRKTMVPNVNDRPKEAVATQSAVATNRKGGPYEKRGNDGQEQLHPSWAAAKKAKANAQAGASAFTGQKMTLS